MRGLPEDVVALRQMLVARRAVIEERFYAALRDRLGSGLQSRRELLDHFPHLLGDIVELLDEGNDRWSSPQELDVELHVADRLERGFDIDAMVREYKLLRTCLLEVWQESLGGGPFPPVASMRLNAILDSFIAQAAQVHQDETMRGESLLQRMSDAGERAAGDPLRRIAELSVGTIAAADAVSFFVVKEGGVALAAHAAVNEGLGPQEAGARDAVERRAAVISADDACARSRFTVPLIDGDAVVGAAQMSSESCEAFSTRDQLFFRAVADRAASALSQRRALDERMRFREGLSWALGSLDAVFANAPVGLALLDTQLRYVRVNEHLARINGLPPELHVGRTVREVVPSVAPAAEPVLRHVLETGEPVYDLDVGPESPMPGGGEHALISFSPVRAVDGRVVGVAAAVLDITARKRAEDALRARITQETQLAELGLRALRQSDVQAVMDDAVSVVRRTLNVELTKIIELRPDGRRFVLRAGEGWRPGLVGHATESAGDQSQGGYTLLERRPVLSEDLERETRFETSALLKSHGARSGMTVVIAAPGAGGEPWGVLGAHARSPRVFTREDATFLQSVANLVGTTILRGRSEERAAAERTFGQIQKLLADVGRVLIRPGDASEIDRDIVRLLVPHLGTVAAAWIPAGRGPARCTAAVWPADAEREESVCDVLARAPGVEELFGRVLQKRLPVHGHAPAGIVVRGAGAFYVAVPMATADEVFGVLVLGRREAPYGRAEAQVAVEVGRRWALALENARLTRALEDAVRAREDVLSIVSHDLRNPLNGVRLAAGALQREAAREGQGFRGRAWVESIERGTARMGRLIEDLLDFDSLRSGKLRLRLQAVEPSEIAHEAGDMFRAAAEEKGIRLDLDLRDGVPVCACDRDRILQVLSNLLGNALKVTPQQGVISVSMAPHRGAVLFAVRDTGPGIVRDDLAHVFERYWRGRTGIYKGTGLGLAIARGIVEAHGGRIWARSSPGHGSVFFFTVPAASAVPSHADQHP